MFSALAHKRFNGAEELVGGVGPFDRSGKPVTREFKGFQNVANFDST
jgi:hypothetical protein